MFLSTMMRCGSFVGKQIRICLLFHNSYCIFLFKKVFTLNHHFREEGHKERERDLSFIHSFPKQLLLWGLSLAGCFIPFPHVDSRSPRTSSHCCPRHMNREPELFQDVGIAGSGFTHQATTLTLIIFIIFRCKTSVSKRKILYLFGKTYG